jgi:hypothetical protein
MGGWVNKWTIMLAIAIAFAVAPQDMIYLVHGIFTGLGNLIHAVKANGLLK